MSVNEKKSEEKVAEVRDEGEIAKIKIRGNPLQLGLSEPGQTMYSSGDGVTLRFHDRGVVVSKGNVSMLVPNANIACMWLKG